MLSSVKLHVRGVVADGGLAVSAGCSVITTPTVRDDLQAGVLLAVQVL